MFIIMYELVYYARTTTLYSSSMHTLASIYA